MRGLLAGDRAESWIDTEEIDSGFYSAVFALGDNLVVKVSSDSSDARAAVHVKALQDRGGGVNLVRVHAVFVVGRNSTRYVLVNERLDPAPDEIKRHAYDSKYDIGGADDIIRGANRRASGIHTWRYFSMDKDLSTNWGLAAALNLNGIVCDLVAAGISDYPDFHGKNIMVRHEPNGGKRVVLVDFGLSTSPDIEIAA